MVDIWRRALEELLSDIVGTILFGPAALFSTLNMSLMCGLDDTPEEATDYYPPWRTRLRAVLAVCDEQGGFFPVDESTFPRDGSAHRASQINAVVSVIRSLAAEKADEQALQRDPLVALAYRSLEKWLAAGKTHLKALLDAASAGANGTIIRQRLPTLIERLDQQLPPNEYDIPHGPPQRAGLAEILNAAWYHRLTWPRTNDEQPLAERMATALDKRQAMNQLTLKAIEYSDLAAWFATEKPD